MLSQKILRPARLETDPETQRLLKHWLQMLGYETVITTTVGHELENLVKHMIVLNDPALDRTLFLRTSTPGTAAPVAAPPSGNGHAPTTSAPAPTHGGGSVASGDRVPLKEIARAAARAAEREAIARVLEETRWNRLRAARLLKCSYRALLYKIKDGWFDARRGASTDGRDRASKPSAPGARRLEPARRSKRVSSAAVPESQDLKERSPSRRGSANSSRRPEVAMTTSA
jgi:hypothetical protein